MCQAKIESDQDGLQGEAQDLVRSQKDHGMLVGIYQSGMLLGITLTFYAIDFVLMAHYDRTRKSQRSGRNWRFTLKILGMVVFMVAQPLAWPWLSIQLKADWAVLIQLAGLGVIVCGLILYVWSRLHLRRFYVERVELQAEHQVIEGGPYSYIRHPVFVAFFAIAIGVVLINPSVPTLILMVYTFWDFGQAAKREEQLLSSQLPAYAAYMQRTGRFLPRLGKSSPSSK